MAALLIQFVGLALVVAVAGTFLARSADTIAEATGLGRLLVGSILLAATTSLPELTVNLTAVSKGAVDLAVGDLLGACLMNLLVLAVLDLALRSRAGMLSRQAAAHAMSATIGITLAAIAGIGVMSGGHLPPVSWLGLGPASWSLLVCYVLGARLVFLDQRIAARSAREETATAPPAPGDGRPPTLGRAVATFAAAALVIVLAGPRLALVADALADRSGLGGTLVGTTLLAICTTLPEAATSIAAVRAGASDLAIGNVFGSNAFNLFLLVPLDVAWPGPLLAAVSPLHVVTALGIVVATAIAVLGQLYRAERRLMFIEPDAFLVIAACLTTLWLVSQLAPVIGQVH